MKYDYVSMGFHTFDCLGRPFSTVPPKGGTVFLDEIAMAVSGAAGAAAIVAAKHGLKCLAVGGVGQDLMGEWVLRRFDDFGIDRSGMQLCPDAPTSSSIVLTRADGSRPALHMKGATGAFIVDEALQEKALDTRILHIGGTGLMDRMDGERSFALFAEARRRGVTTTLDVFAATQDDLPNVLGLLPNTDYFLPSIEEAQALSGHEAPAEAARFFIDHGVTCCILTLGENGAYYHHRDGTRFVMPAFDIEMICSCGCGDAFNAGVATGLSRGMDPESMVRFAQATSALNATGLGSQAGVSSFEETLAFTRRPTRPSAVTADTIAA